MCRELKQGLCEQRLYQRNVRFLTGIYVYAVVVFMSAQCTVKPQHSHPYSRCSAVHTHGMLGPNPTNCTQLTLDTLLHARRQPQAPLGVLPEPPNPPAQVQGVQCEGGPRHPQVPRSQVTVIRPSQQGRGALGRWRNDQSDPCAMRSTGRNVWRALEQEHTHWCASRKRCDVHCGKNIRIGVRAGTSRNAVLRTINRVIFVSSLIPPKPFV